MTPAGGPPEPTPGPNQGRSPDRLPDLHSAAFADPPSLREELERVFAICTRCRLCEPLCGAFPAVFAGRSSDEVVGHCFQCQRCLAQCPYAPPRDDMVDFPFLMMRALLSRRRRTGLSAGERVLANPDLALAALSLGRPLLGPLLKVPAGRAALERVIPLDRGQPLPRLTSDVFERWFRKKERGFNRRIKGENGTIALFAPCRMNYFAAPLGRKIVELFHGQGIRVVIPNTRCCGAFALEVGDEERFRENARENLRALGYHAGNGTPIVVPDPTCAWMLGTRIPQVLGGKDREQAERIAALTFGLMEYLGGLERQGRLRGEWKAVPGRVALHRSCPGCAEGDSDESVRLLSLVPGLEVRIVADCCSAGTVWGMGPRHRGESLGRAAGLGRALTDEPFDRVLTESPQAAGRIEEMTLRKAEHPVEVLHESLSHP